MAMSLKAHRAEAGLTQEEVCKELKIGKNTIVNYEKFRTIPDIETAKRFAKLYNTTVDDIKWTKE